MTTAPTPSADRRERVLDEVPEHPIQRQPVRRDRERRALGNLGGQGHARGRGARAESGRRRGDDLARVEHLRPDLLLAGSDPLDRTDLGHEPLQPPGLLLDRLRRRLGRVALGRSVGERGREARDDGQRRAQVMAQVGEELALAPARGIELRGHGVERAGQLAHLLRAGKRERRGAPGRDVGGGVREPAQRARHAARNGDRERRRDQQDRQDHDRDRSCEVRERERPGAVEREECDRPRGCRRGAPQAGGDVQVALSGDGHGALDRLADGQVGRDDRPVRRRAAGRLEATVGPDERHLHLPRGELRLHLQDGAAKLAGPDAVPDLREHAAGDVRERAERRVLVQPAERDEEGATDDQHDGEGENREGADEPATEGARHHPGRGARAGGTIR